MFRITCAFALACVLAVATTADAARRTTSEGGRSSGGRGSAGRHHHRHHRHGYHHRHHHHRHHYRHHHDWRRHYVHGSRGGYRPGYYDRGYRGWTRKYYWGRYRAWTYFDGRSRGWFYWHATRRVFLPVVVIAEAPPPVVMEAPVQDVPTQAPPGGDPLAETEQSDQQGA